MLFVNRTKSKTALIETARTNQGIPVFAKLKPLGNTKSSLRNAPFYVQAILMTNNELNNNLFQSLLPHSVGRGCRHSPPPLLSLPLSLPPVVGRSASPPPSEEEDAAPSEEAAVAAAMAAECSALLEDGSISIETWCDCKIRMAWSSV